MSNFLKKGLIAAAAGAAAVITPMMAYADNVHIRVQAVLGTQTSEVAMLRDFMDDVTDLTNGEVTFEILPAGAVVGFVKHLMRLIWSY